MNTDPTCLDVGHSQWHDSSRRRIVNPHLQSAQSKSNDPTPTPSLRGSLARPDHGYPTNDLVYRLTSNEISAATPDG